MEELLSWAEGYLPLKEYSFYDWKISEQKSILDQILSFPRYSYVNSDNTYI